MKEIGVFAGAFNPVTCAHVALAQAASSMLDEIVFVVPRVYPHKEFHGADLEQRIDLLKSATRHRIETTPSGLFIDIARQLKKPDTELYFICGKDAAERVIEWDYGESGAIEKLLDEFSLLVAEREGAYEAPAHLRHRIRHLQLAADFSDVSSSEVRRRIAAGEPWEHLVPDAITDRIRKIYAA
jgi:nicotinate-nucleotide adenylyltransferase